MAKTAFSGNKSKRLSDLIRFYDILAKLEHDLGEKRVLESCDGRMGWPNRGVYFFFETGENRSQSGIGPRVVRVGTHALIKKSRTTLWERLKQHKGHHRASIFRLHVGTALNKRDTWPKEIGKTWGKGKNTAPEVGHAAELPGEQAVSRHILQMPFIWLEVGDPPGPNSKRGFIERNAIALLSNFKATDPLDPPGPSWLGRWADSDFIRISGLWNIKHVAETYDPEFLDILEDLVTTKQ
jgi:hypothetical protein